MAVTRIQVIGGKRGITRLKTKKFILTRNKILGIIISAKVMLGCLQIQVLRF